MITFSDVRQSRLPQVQGLCSGDTPSLRRLVSEAQRNLVYAGGETGWWGGWQRTVFTVAADNTVTLPREISSIRNVSVCESPIPVLNGWYEFLEGGIGPQPGSADCAIGCPNAVRLLDRGFFPTVRDIDTENQRIRAYLSSAGDVGKKILWSGKDHNDRAIRNLYDGALVNGEYVELESPWVDTLSGFKEITSAQKDITLDDVLIYQYDMITGDEVQLAIYAPDETKPAYRRYYIDNMPSWCCSGQTVQVIGMAKVEPLEIFRDTDVLVIQNISALIAECQSIRYSEMDSPQFQGLAVQKHKQAIKFLQDELRHYLGSHRPAITNPIFGTARLEYKMVGQLI